MAKSEKTLFFCSNCGYESAKWMGQCPACHEWNTFTEAPKAAETPRSVQKKLNEVHPVRIADIRAGNAVRMTTHMMEMDRVLGGGIVKGSLVLVGGDPGIGKSTLLLQMCRLLSADNVKMLYVSGEESLEQIRIRADRMGHFGSSLELLSETDLDLIDGVARRMKPDILIIDSIQTMQCESVDSAPGSVTQVRQSTGMLMKLAKGLDITVFVVGHVTKEGVVAGPRVLEHMVDTVLYFEGDRHASYRILRSVKNRFGSTDEIGVFEMTEQGLMEVDNPSEFMLNGRPEHASGSVVSCSIEGTRPVLIEIQALVTRTSFGLPRRTAAGCDYNRVNLLLAVLEKRLGLRLSEYDAYVNMAGGIRIGEPAMDLGICLALISSLKDRAVDDSLICFGEVGLSGEVRAVSFADQRINEAAKLGFRTVILPASNLKGLHSSPKIRLIGVRTVGEAVDALAGES